MKRFYAILLLLAACFIARAYVITNVTIGTVANDGTGDPLRIAFGKINTNFYALTNIVSELTNSINASSNVLYARIVTGASVTETDGTVTNTFPVDFISLPNVTATQFGLARSATNAIVSITVSNFVYTAEKAGVSNQWIAVGP